VTVNDVLDNLGSLLEKWPELLLNPRFIRRENDISWQAYAGGADMDALSEFEVARLASAGQYSFQMFDGSLLRFFYSFDRTGRQLVSANVGYMQNVSASQDSDLNDEGYEDVEDSPSMISISDNLQIVPWIRIDYSPDACKGCTHSKCHLHSSLSSNLRIPVSSVPSPEQFLEAIVAWFYPQTYEGRHLDANGHFRDFDRLHDINVQVVTDVTHLEGEQILHIRLPDHAAIARIRQAIN
jgi:hypothetical protein